MSRADAADAGQTRLGPPPGATVVIPGFDDPRAHTDGCFHRPRRFHDVTLADCDSRLGGGHGTVRQAITAGYDPCSDCYGGR